MRWGLPIALILVFIFTSFPAAAQSGQPWQIRELAGDARVEVDGVQPVALTPGDQLTPGQRIVTGSSGRVVLERGDERIVVSPDSVVGLPAQNDGNFATRILHRLGTILLDVEHKDHQHFEVVTPFMTAVVKGTRFTVSVQQGASAVQVLDGLVEVSDAQGRGRTLVRPGETASADDSGLALNGQSVDPGTGDTVDDTTDDTTNDGAPTEAADAGTDATTTQTAAASDDAAASGSGAQVTLPDQASETAAVAIGKTLGDDTIDIASLTDGLLDGPTGGPGNSGGAGSANARGNGLGPTGAPGRSRDLPEVAQGDGPSRVARAGTSGNNGNSANNSNAGNGPPRHANAGGNSGNNGNPGNGGNPGNSGNSGNNGNGGNPGNNGNNGNGNNGNPGNNGNNGNNGNGGNNGQGNGNG